MVIGLEFKAITPTVIVGIGGTGIEVLQYLKAKIKGMPSVIKIVGIDVALQPTPRPDGDKLSSNEFIKIGVGDNIQEIIAKLDSFAHIKRWMKPEFRHSGTLEEGADQRRILGRLALFWNLEREEENVYTKLESIIRAIRDRDIIRETEDAGYEIRKVTDGGVPARVIIIGSLGGGTGSGIFLDLAYLIRSVFKGANDEVISIFVLPEAFTEGDVNKEGVKANTYAAFKELEHFVNNGFECEYTSTLRVSFEKADRVPFDYIYLINGASESGITYGKRRVVRIVGDVVHSFLGTDIEAYRQLLTNARAAIRPPKLYNSFGFSSIVLPIDEIIDYCTYSTCIGLINEILEPVNSEEVENDTGNFVIGQKISKSDLIADLDNALTAKRQELRLGDIDLEDISADDVENTVRGWKAAQLQKISEVKESLNAVIEEKFTEDKDKGLEDKRRKLEEKVEELTNKHDKGLILAIDFLSGLDNKLGVWNISVSEEKERILSDKNAAKSSEENLRAEYIKTLRSRVARITRARRSAKESLENNLKMQVNQDERIAVLDAYTTFYPKFEEKEKEVKSILDNIKRKIEDNKDSRTPEEKDFGKLKAEIKRKIEEIENSVRIDNMDWFLHKIEVNIPRQKVSLMEKKKIFDWKDNTREEIGEILFKHLREVCKGLEERGVVDYMEEKKIDYKREAENLIETTSPLWQYKVDPIKPKPISLLFAGRNAHNRVSESVSEVSTIEVSPSENEYKIACAKYSHGLPIRLLTWLSDYKTHYDFRIEREEEDNWPLHIDYSIKFEDIS